MAISEILIILIFLISLVTYVRLEILVRRVKSENPQVFAAPLKFKEKVSKKRPKIINEFRGEEENGSL